MLSSTIRHHRLQYSDPLYQVLNRLRLSEGGMSANERSDGLLRALQDLPEADRDRIVKHLPPEEVQNVFSLLLRKQDRVSRTFETIAFGTNGYTS